ncbi:HutD family protein [Streptomyces rubellomurinus]|uniref:HutD family protein n=1 Tax=Streptomyces sp. Y1 TaxID=3238634 RepID=A0AB39TFX1_9ACTN|nr:HutD family protein [Streptomyces rubellomurinus]
MTTSGRIQVLRASERPASPWLNGGGVTREVAGFPAGAGLDGFDWRVSLADVASAGPFSVFPGIDRVITLVEGAGMVLTVDGTEQPVDTPLRPFAFPGDATTDCRLLGGPVVDFNVMTRRGRVEATVEVVRTTSATVDVPPSGTVLLVCLAGAAHLDGLELARYDAALVDAPGRYELRLPVDGGSGAGAVAVVAFHPTAS